MLRRTIGKEILGRDRVDGSYVVLSYTFGYNTTFESDILYLPLDCNSISEYLSSLVLLSVPFPLMIIEFSV